MAPKSGAVFMLSSPSADAASQQLLAEASSPVRRPTATPTAAQRGASLLNAARALPKPPTPAPASTGKAGKLLKSGRLKPAKLQKLGQLPRASLSSLVSESSQKKVRGKQMYDIDLSPEKKRRSLPAHTAAFVNEEEDVVPETSQVQPDDDAPTDIPESLDVSGPKESLFGDDDIVDAPSSPVAPREKGASSATKKQKGRSRTSDDSVVSRASEASAAVVQVEVQDESSVETQKRRGRPRKSGESTVSRRSVGDTAAVENEVQKDVQEDVPEDMREDVQEEPKEQAERLAVTVKPKRKAHPNLDIEAYDNGEPSTTTRPTKKIRKLKGPKMISPDAPEFEEDSVPLMAAFGQDAQREVQRRARQEAREVRRQERQQAAQPRGDPQPQVKIPIRSTRPRTVPTNDASPSATQQSAASGHTIAIERKGKTAQRITRNTRAAMTASAPEPAKRTRSSKKTQNIVDGQPHEVLGGASDDADNATDAAANRQDDDRQENSQGREEFRDDEQREEQAEAADAADEQEGGDAGVEGTDIPALDTVFEFAASEERPGVCSMGLARKLHRRCDRIHVTLSGESCSLEDIKACKDELVRSLKSVNTHVQEDNRAEFKRDAFAYLFRALTRVLKTLYNKMQDREGNPVESYQALQMIHPFVREMLRFKDTMDVWKVKVQQHAHGERLIKRVETGLIAPLRIVEKELKTRLSAFQRAEQDRQARVEMQRQREKQEQDMVRREEALRSEKERRKRWQDLHIARMQCESDPYRRRRLRLVELLDAAETDANGDRFERVPFFVERNAPPPSSVATTSDKEWTHEQETVLLDSLQSSSSLERIFRKHCRAGGALRDFSVSDFAAKLAWVRAAWAQLSHQHGWELPEWVKEIPVLP